MGNTGKSEFIRLVREIFASDEVSWDQVYLPVRKRNRPELEAQIVTCEEFNPTTALGKGILPTTKLLFEGQGANVRDGLYQPHKHMYESAVFVISSNRLPGQDEKDQATFDQDVWQPLSTRVDFTHLMTAHDGKSEFPYTKG